MNKDDLLYEIIDRIGQTQDSMREILVEMQVDLKYHIKRTDLLEEEVNILKSQVEVPFPWKKVGVIVSVIGAISGVVMKMMSL